MWSLKNQSPLAAERGWRHPSYVAGYMQNTGVRNTNTLSQKPYSLEKYPISHKARKQNPHQPQK